MISSRPDRLFVPLAAGPFAWFANGRKHWELRRYGRQFTDQHVFRGRRVELRRGYRAANSALWGIVADVTRVQGLEEFFKKVPFNLVIPIALSEQDAIRIAGEILNIVDQPDVDLLGFRIEFGQPE